MATEEVVYLSYAGAVPAHIELMRYIGETRYGVFDRSLVESALSRPRQAATYESADLIAAVDDIVELVLKVESGVWQLAEIEDWLRAHVSPLIHSNP